MVLFGPAVKLRLLRPAVGGEDFGPLFEFGPAWAVEGGDDLGLVCCVVGLRGVGGGGCSIRIGLTAAHFV